MKRILAFGSLLSAVLFFFFSCQKELSQESNLNNAAYTFHNDTSFACLSDTIQKNGTYYDGVSAERDTNFVKVIVNVTKTGDYTIATDSVNGYFFAASGFFSKLGPDTLILAAKGTPILIQTNDFTLSDSLGNCGFSIDVFDSTGTGLGGVDTIPSTTPSVDTTFVDTNPATDSSWHFTDSATGDTYDGTMPTANNSLVDSNGTFVLTIAGFTTDFSQTFGFQLYLPSSTISTGVYAITGNTSLGVVGTADSSIVFISNQLLITGADSYSYVKITSYDAATKHIEGSFHCWAIDITNTLHLLKGSFNTYLP